MIAASSKLTVQVVTDQHRESTRHLELHFDQPLLMQGEGRTITPGPHALDQVLEFTPLMQDILRKLFGPEDMGVTQAIVTNEHLTIDHFAALSLEQILDIIREAAFRTGMVCYSSSDSL